MSDPGPKPKSVPLTEAQKRVAADNVGLVHHMVRQMVANSCMVDGDDLASAGYEGLIRAARAFDSGRGYKFSTYACRAIWNQMRREVRHVRLRFRMHQLPKGGKHKEIMDRRPRTKADQETVEICGAAMDALSETERMVLNLTFVQKYRQRQIAPLLGVTGSRVWSIKEEALVKARAAAEKAMGELAAA